jgi:hypothetical protein
MPHLHLPADHSDADLVLAANVAAIVGSEDLYVAWTHETGAGAIPEVEAVMREERPGVVLGFVGMLVSGIRALWSELTQVPAPAAPQTSAPVAPARETSS